MEHTSKASFGISPTVVKILRHAPELRESDGATPWNTLMYQCKGFERTVYWTFEDWKRCLETGTNKIRFEHCLDHQIQCMISVQGHFGATNEAKTALQYAHSFRKGHITFITWYHRTIIGPSVNEVSLQEDSDFEKGEKHAS